MPSIVPDYEYDIFISYRQNDNLDGWVTDFVLNLEKELKATIKEPLSIYFDKNPYDGLLETHNVDKSLEGKLKCLIFIPILSQTYCDSKSFAWQHEFCAFNKLAKEDQFGTNVKLSNGNFANRILPIKIRDLDAEDSTIIASELGAPLRALEFIYKEQGVNRPLRPSDNRNENKKKTEYQNQVSRVANGVKEVITALKDSGKRNFDPSVEEENSALENDKSIVVLPFEDMSHDRSQEFFCDGLSEELISLLSRIKDVHVVARTSAFAFKGKEQDVRKIGKKLNVRSLLEGSVRVSGKNLRITAKLINVEDGFPIWSERYDRELTDVFAIQDEIAETIVNKLKVNLVENELSQSAGRQTTNLGAYNLYLQGRYFWNKWTTNDFFKSIEFYDQALKLDPGYASCYAAKAESCFHLGLGYWGIKPMQMLPDALAAVDSAIKIDRNLGEAFAIRGGLKLWNEYDLTNAEADLKIALKLNPNSATVHDYYSHTLTVKKKHKEAIEEIEKAVALDPLSYLIIANSSLAYYRARLHGEAIIRSAKLKELYPDFPMWCLVGFPLVALKKFDEAIDAFRSGVENSGRHPAYLCQLAYGLGSAGLKSEAESIMQELEERAKTEYLWSVGMAMAYTSLGKFDKAIHLLNTAYEDHAAWVHWLDVEPAFDVLREQYEFKELVRKINL